MVSDDNDALSSQYTAHKTVVQQLTQKTKHTAP